MKKLLTLALISALSFSAAAQISARLMKEMDVSQNKIAFVYGGDIWIVDKTGGTASQLTNSQGDESFPKFSPDGSQIAYTASYNGNDDVFVIPVTGGIPTRITYASHYDRMIEWHPDGNKLIFASRRQSSTPRVNHFYSVSTNGGVPERLHIPYGELGTFSPDGNQFAYTTKITENYPFKRYRGGLTSDVLIYNFDSNKIDRVTSETAIDSKPAWGKDLLYFLSDRDEAMRLNIWSYNTTSKQLTKITNFTDFDISHLSSGPNELVFANGGKLYTLTYGESTPKEVEVRIVSDLSVEIEQAKDVSKSITNMTASPGGKRIVFEARGELFNVPVKEGYSLNMTNSSGAFDQNPAWSPDGKFIAYWSDKSGEYELYLHNANDHSEKKITDRKKGFGYALYWSPDSEKIAFIDETNTIYFVEINSGKTTTVDNFESGDQLIG
jgi:tricorn protease